MGKEIKNLLKTDIEKVRQLTLQEKWEIDAELARKNSKNEKEIKGPVIGRKVSTEEMKRILKGEE